MGLDNIPKPLPCKVLEKSGKLKVVRTKDGKIDCDKTNCPFKPLRHYLGLFAAYCWIRGKAYNKIVEKNTKYSLYNDLTRKELENILKTLKEVYEFNDKTKRIVFELTEADELRDEDERLLAFHLIEYLETLLSIKEWDGELIAWY